MPDVGGGNGTYASLILRFGTGCVGAMTERVLWRRLRSSYGNTSGVMSYEDARV